MIVGIPEFSRLDTIIELHRKMRNPIPMILSQFQKEFGFIPEAIQQRVAHLLKVPFNEVSTAINIYKFLTVEPKGKYAIGICLSSSCHHKGSQEILNVARELLGINVGETTADGLFTLNALYCIDECDQAPAMNVNRTIYTKMVIPKLIQIVDDVLAQEHKINASK